MKTFRRLFVTLKSQIDSVADEFENHEALAGAAIKDLESIGSKTRIHLHKVREMAHRYEKRLDDLNAEADRWAARAVAVREQDEQRALECVRRLRATKQQIEHLDKQLRDTRAMDTRVKADLDRIQTELQTVKKKRELFAARQNRADLMAMLDKHGFERGDDIEAIFERWETNIVGAEFNYQDIEEIDDLAAGFEKEEEQADLKALLDELTEAEKSRDENGGN